MNSPRKQGAERRPRSWLDARLDTPRRRANVAYLFVALDGLENDNEENDAEPVVTAVDERLLRLLGWQERLLAAVQARDLLSLLNDFGFTDRELIRSANGEAISARTLRRWRLEGFPDSKADERWEQLDDLRAIIGFMLADGTYDEAGILAWLRSRQPDLELRRPLDVLGEGRFGDVLRSVERTLGPTPARDRIGAIRNGVGESSERRRSTHRSAPS